MPLNRSSALCFAEMLAVRAQPHQAHRPVSGHLDRIDGPYRFAQVESVRVVDGVHGESFRVMVHRNVYRPSECLFEALARAAAPCKVVDDQFITEIEREIAGIRERHIASRAGRLEVPTSPARAPRVAGGGKRNLDGDV